MQAKIVTKASRVYSLVRDAAVLYIVHFYEGVCKKIELAEGKSAV